MSSIFQSDKLEKDFELFKDEIFKLNTVSADDSIKSLPEFKRYHSLIYAIALIQIKVKKPGMDLCKFVFLAEIQSDLLLLITHLVFGFKNTSMLTYRRVIENFYNHIYYFNHEIEFAHLNNGRNEYSPIIDLKNYLTSYPYFPKTDRFIKEFNDYIFNEYTELNKYVHSKGVDFMGLSKSLTELKQIIDYEKTLQQMNEVIYRILYILYKFHVDIKMKHVELKLITDCIPRDKRANLNQ